MRYILIIALSLSSCAKAQDLVKYGHKPLLVNMPSIDNIFDESGNNNHLTIGGQAPPAIVSNTFITGKKATKFSGKTNLAAEGYKYVLPSTYTIEFRFKRDISNLSKSQIVCARWGSPGQQQYVCYFDATNKLSFLQYGSSALQSAAITDSNSHMAAVTKSGASYSLFLDGQLVQTLTAGTIATVNDSIPFRVGNYDDNTSTTSPLYGTLADFRFSNIVRYSANYTPAGNYLPSDANTLSLLHLDSLAGRYLGEPVYMGNILTRTGNSQASGGWANPDGILMTRDNKYYFTASAYDGTKWTVWAAISDNPAGPYVLQGTTIQTPAADESDLSGNGSVVYLSGKYYHYYQNSGAVSNIKVSTGNTLNETYPEGTIIFRGGTGGYDHFFDPWVRKIPYSDTLEMYFNGSYGGLSTNRVLLYSKSADGLTWSAPVLLGSSKQPFNSVFIGEGSHVNVFGNSFLTGDGATTSSVGREVVRWVRKGDKLLPLLKFIGASGGGYIATYDSSPYLDAANNRIIYLTSNSTNTQQAQPTNSDIAIWYVPILSAD